MLKAYLFKITLKGSHPVIWRKVIIPSDMTFKRLHEVIQIAMGWNNFHLYRFQFKDLKLIVSNIDEKSVRNNTINNVSIKDAKTTTINKYFENCEKFTYVYDFGDWWEHRIEPLEKLYNYNYSYPQIIKAKGNCPPEDCGGIYGYYDFLNIYNDPSHPKHEKISKWAYEQAYDNFDINKANALMNKLLVLDELDENLISAL